MGGKSIRNHDPLRNWGKFRWSPKIRTAKQGQSVIRKISEHFPDHWHRGVRIFSQFPSTLENMEFAISKFLTDFWRKIVSEPKNTTICVLPFTYVFTYEQCSNASFTFTASWASSDHFIWLCNFGTTRSWSGHVCAIWRGWYPLHHCHWQVEVILPTCHFWIKAQVW